MISVLILTFNEEINIARCIESVRWSDDVLVLDSFSTDRTVQLAKAAGARILQRSFDHFAPQRNYGLEHGSLKYDWVLHLDADEQVTPAFKQEACARISSGNCDAYRVPSKMMFQGRWLKHAGMYPTYQVRLGKRDVLKFMQAGHGQREDLPPERLGTMDEALLHYSFSKGLEDWIAKHNRYSSAEAFHEVSTSGVTPDFAGLIPFSDRVRRRRALKQIAARLPFRPLLRFFYMYFLRLGFLDGPAGYRYCRLLARYEHMIVIKVHELRRQAKARPR